MKEQIIGIKTSFTLMFLIAMTVQVFAQNTDIEQEIIDLSQ